MGGFVFLLLLSGCVGLTPLKPLDATLETAIMEECGRPFLTEKSRLVHRLSALLPNGGTVTAIGVLEADPRDRSFRSVLMTLEGLVLFDIEGGRVQRVHRAVPPFDAPGLAARLTEDIGLAFFLPAGKPIAWGEGEGGFRGCRYAHGSGRFVDVLADRGGSREIRLYGAGQALLKRVKMPFPELPGLAGEIEIRGEGDHPYGLNLRLIEAEAVRQ